MTAATLPTGARPVARSSPARLPSQVRRSFDALCVLALTGLSYLTRRGSLPSDGLWFDDSWVAAGAMLGSPRQLLIVGSGHPGFTGLLMVVDRLGGDLAALGVPSLVAGIASPPLLYLALRSFGYERALSSLLAAALVVAPIPIIYSGRVKGYTLDTVLVLALGMALPALARRTWRWPLGVAWTITAVVIGSFSGYALVATAGAGVILALHPASDRLVRWASVGVQAAIQAVYLKVAQSKTDLAGIEEVMEVAYDGHLDLSLNPLTSVRTVLTHLGRVAEVFPAGPDGWLSVLGLLAVAGLVAAAWGRGSRTETIAGRYFAALVGIAFVGGAFDRFPFGPTNLVPASAGGRHTLWMVPAIAFGLAAVAHRLRALVARRDELRFGFDGLAVVLAVAVVGFGYGPAPEAPFPGSGSAAAFAQSSRQPGDVLLVPGSSIYTFAISSEEPHAIRATPDHQIGFVPHFTDPDVHSVGSWAVTPGTPADVRRWVDGTDRVFVLRSGALAAGDTRMPNEVLRAEGFTVESHLFEWAAVDVWSR